MLMANSPDNDMRNRLELKFRRKYDKSSHYDDYTVTDGYITRIETYDTAAMGTKYFTQDITWTNGVATLLVTTDHISGRTLTSTRTYDANGNTATHTEVFA